MVERPWLKNYESGLPHTLRPYPQCTLLDVMSDTVRQRPGHTALIFKGTRVSYARLEQLTNAFGAALVAQGVRKGDRVAMLLPNSPQSIVAQLGAWKAGAIAAPINSLYTPRELEHALNEVGAETVVVLTPLYDKVKSLQARTAVRRVIATNIKEYLPAHLRWLFTVAKEKKEGHRLWARTVRSASARRRSWWAIGGRPDETADMIRDGWVCTGELGRMDEDGYLFIVDRKKDLIKPGGFQVWPREVEEVIATHPAVAEVSVAGVPDQYLGEAVKAWVVLRQGQQLTVEELRAYCKERLAGYKVPKQVEFRDSLPKSMVGKVLRRVLAKDEAG